jgi:putative MATE family efflux protein
MKKRKANLTHGSEAVIISRMAGGMLFGFGAMAAFNAVDTYFVGQLGAVQLAAMSFTFPVVMLLHAISFGLGIGLSSVVSRAIGAGDPHKVHRLVTDGLILAVAVVLIVSLCGLLTIHPLFSLLGAKGETLELIRKYMFIWYLGVPFVIIPMTGNNAIRATGDTLTPSLIMVAAVVVNIILDPLLIFGIGPFPALGISGAAIATVVSRFSSLLLSLGILGMREKLLSFEIPDRITVFASWRQIAFVGAPAALVQMITPLSLGVITRLLAHFGEKVVAGFGAAGRVEMLAMIIPMSLAAVMAPFTGQNWGARKGSRIIRGVKFSSLVSIVWGGVLFIAGLFCAEQILGLFSSDADIIHAGAGYLRMVSVSYGFLGILVIASQCFNALNRPLESAGITLIRSFVINIPLALLGAHLWGETGVFSASLVTNLVAGSIGFGLLMHFLRKHESEIQ